ncbi:TPA: DUF853 family protein [Escherichia coli]|nr:DUF853 family protein [Escherichia coli]HAW8149212.1 DUF853 family protein [Escherichia coli]
MRNHRISLQDIATLAGVTKMTVSRYIRSPKKVAKETGERIAKIMEEINYIPNRAPGMLLNAQSYTLGILIPSFQNQLFADILAGIESVTSVHNYQTLIANYNYDRDSEEESVINLLSYNIDGIILSEKYHTIRTVKFLRSATIPVVELMDVQGERLDMEVGFDNRQAAFDMVCTMLDKRVRRKILYLGSKDDTRDEQRYQGLLLLDFKDLRAITQYIGDNAKSFQNQYGNISSASVGAIQRGLLSLEQQGAAHFFGEPMLDIKDWMRTDANGKGVINILSAEKLYQMPKLYAASLLWMLSELYEQLPEAGDLEKPKLVFFFDEAHLLFNDAPQVLLDKIEQVIRLIRSKGVGVWFVSQNPSDIPDNVLGQLGNRVQHALRAFTPKDQKAVKAAAQTMRANPAFDTEKAIQELGTGEALISFLDAKGSPSVVERAMVIAPCSRMGPVTEDERNGLINHSPVYGKYEDDVDRESAYEMLQKGFQASIEQQNNPPAKGKEVAVDDGILGGLKDILFGTTGPRGGKKDGVVQTMAKSAARQVTNQIVRGMLGSLLGGRRR